MATKTTSKKPTEKKISPAKKATKKSASSNEVSDHSYDIHKSLLEHFGFDKFKGTQEQAINTLLSGRDTFVIMPTGGGKSL
ncbi:MAG TPA: ATP-dependent DNA helicase RecQ, partial [Segetibacter sp.]